MEKTEEIIIEINKNAILHDQAGKDYKDIVKNRDIWKIIGQKVGFTVM